MRIIAGSLRSRRLVFPKTKKTRPMTDRAKETLFNILGEFVSGANVLDLFAGSGSLGLEALSRGAEKVTFVEHGPWGLKCIRENLKQLGLTPQSEILAQDIFRAIGQLEKRGEKFTLIFSDPPYNQGLVKKILNRLSASGIVTPLTKLVVHHSRQEPLPKKFEILEVIREVKIGQAYLSFLSRRN